MAATDHPARVTAEGSIDKGVRVWVKCIEVTASATPSAADLGTDINAGPGEDRRRRQIDRRRGRGRLGRKRNPVRAMAPTDEVNATGPS